MQTLVAVADTGSFAAAARIVNLTASAVSQQIQALEAEMDTNLFDRSKRPPQLNAKGDEVVRAARQMLQIMAETRATISGGRKGGMLGFGAIRTFSTRLVPNAFARMRADHPNLTFNLQVGMSETLMAHVASGRLDAAVVADNVGVPPGLVWTPILSEPLLLVAPAAQRGATDRPLFRRLPFIRYETPVPLSRQIETELSNLGVPVREIAVSNTMPAVVGCVLAGMGVAVVPKIALLDAPEGGLYVQPFGAAPITRRVGLVRRQISSRSAVLERMRAALLAQAESLGLDALTDDDPAPAA
ncbi:LysR family transcriptional regulator [Citreimonas sp.]|uniref:LysR family transcriptional regulator n=1 Tax=Citreimonas sp. TaxID=3036715 RepID=UPI004058B830